MSCAIPRNCTLKTGREETHSALIPNIRNNTGVASTSGFLTARIRVMGSRIADLFLVKLLSVLRSLSASAAISLYSFHPIPPPPSSPTPPNLPLLHVSLSLCLSFPYTPSLFFTPPPSFSMSLSACISPLLLPHPSC